MAHYMRLRIYGHADEPRRRAVDGSGSAHIAGYRVVPTLAGPRLEHIAVAEKALGRPLPRGQKSTTLTTIEQITGQKTWSSAQTKSITVCCIRASAR